MLFDYFLQDQQFLSEGLTEFVANWTAHEIPVKAEFTIEGSRVVILVADASTLVTGCSRDKLNHFMQAMGASMRIDFFNRMLIPIFRHGELSIVHWHAIEQLIERDQLAGSDLYVDATIDRIEVFKDHGLKPIQSILVAS